ncbi:Crp/Fnr family transcriptional regulator [Pseudalkalibacillus hwajinpoensis]|uniref:Crp/Fnr family transcriptional regulator n=1 Tax=Guptibacillus hwajinpoensis TaxID=208199 RepID=A0A4U1MLW1_9BACL|nr:Crp/Fnr family transcriptional regulator [Pseudalkalibacillus hwajinpoensis]TKD71450.1 Crp/Fnr family transcriptional regulator [Pseudalkalibacillus hwajinpoensis]
MDKLTMLSQINLFDELEMSDLKQIDNVSDMQPLKKGTIILGPEKPMKALFLLKQGTVRLYRSNAAGKQLTVDLLGDGNIFGETSSFSLTDDLVYAEAMSDVYVCVIGKAQFEELISDNPKLAIKFIEILSSRLKDIYEMSENLALHSVKYRILSLLLKLSEKFGKRKNEWQTIDIKLTHYDIATMIGSTRETVSATIGELKKAGYIKKNPLVFAVHASKTSGFLEEKGE